MVSAAMAPSLCQTWQPGIYFPAPGSEPPHYFSATNARASATIVPYQTNPQGYTYVEDAYLWLNNEIVYHYHQPEGEPPPMSVGLGVVFDSTHFTHGSYLTVKATYVDSHGDAYEASSGGPVKNSAVIAAFPDKSGYPQQAALQAKYYLHDPWVGNVTVGGSFAPQDFIDALVGSSIVFYAGHGNTSIFQCGKFWIGQGGHPFETYVKPMGSVEYWDSGDPTSVRTLPIESNRAAQMGTGYPPYNSTNIPPITLAFYSPATAEAIRISSDSVCPMLIGGVGWWTRRIPVLHPRFICRIIRKSPRPSCRA